MRVTFGFRDLDRQLEDLEAILRQTSQEGRQPASVNLLMKRNIPVTFAPSYASDGLEGSNVEPPSDHPEIRYN